MLVVCPICRPGEEILWGGECKTGSLGRDETREVLEQERQRERERGQAQAELHLTLPTTPSSQAHFLHLRGHPSPYRTPPSCIQRSITTASFPCKSPTKRSCTVLSATAADVGGLSSSSSSSSTSSHNVVVVGAGFAGFGAARVLAHQVGIRFQTLDPRP
jgi:hypothetical protein